jgi:hypothetical protein
MAVSKPWQYTLVAVIAGLVAASALYLFSGDVVVVLFVKAVEKVLSIIVGLIRLKSH